MRNVIFTNPAILDSDENFRTLIKETGFDFLLDLIQGCIESDVSNPRISVTIEDLKNGKTMLYAFDIHETMRDYSVEVKLFPCHCEQMNSI
ncbi:hypothetical protein MFLO_04270 [Listeria floridensis FSL S10-1187]|uniref:Uncharacterized protein n=1 Tax=Listeria floridensis FSL S10-1187 TaxID=1265817 RepID=A0ABN0RGV8_9LIST|nr:hypothetical protein [Listeria floridensis]EUJ33127.1 hypothetical protein MFLO_04270 [Listeria floridensis FSL S10-1187]